MVRNGDTSPRLWMSEYGWTACSSDDPGQNPSRCVSEATQATWIRQAFTLIRTSFPFVDGASWYELRDTEEFHSPGSYEASFGLLRSNFSAKPGLAAYTAGSRPYRDQIMGTPGLLSYWRVGEASGTVARDEKALSSGQYVGPVSLGQGGISGADGNGATFIDSASERISIPHNAAYNLNAFSVELWVYINSYGDASRYRALFKKGDLAADRNFGLWLQGGTDSRVHFSVGREDGSYVSDNSIAQLQPNRWNHLVMTHPANGRPDLYVNGALDKRNAYSVTPATGSTPLLVDPNQGSTVLSRVRVDEAALYGVALAPEQIRAHYDAGLVPGL